MRHLPASMQRGALSRDLVRAHNAAPARVTEERVRAALALLEAMPDASCTPTACIALDGEIFLMWEQGESVLALVPETESRVRYAYSRGQLRKRGIVAYSHRFLPPFLAKMINAFRRCDA